MACMVHNLLVVCSSSTTKKTLCSIILLLWDSLKGSSKRNGLHLQSTFHTGARTPFLCRRTFWRPEAAVISFRMSARCREEGEETEYALRHLSLWPNAHSGNPALELHQKHTLKNAFRFLPKVVAGEHNLEEVEGSEQVRIQQPCDTV